jgi:two-component system sensor histidine kinase DesK
VSQTTETTREETPQPNRFHELWYLIFLVFMFVAPAFNPEAGADDWLWAAAIVVATAAIFVYACLRRRHSLIAAGVLMVLAVVGTLLETAAMGALPIYAAALVAQVGTRRQVIQRLMLISVILLATAPFSPIPMPYLLLAHGPALILVWLVGLSVFEDMSRSQEADRLRAENARIQYLATVTERERIARDLHDLAGQALTAVAMRSQLVQRLADSDPERVKREAAAIEETARQTLSSLRETVAGWQQVDLDFELAKGRDALEAVGVTVEVEGDWRHDLAPSVETVLALALREAVTNVVRHARASRCVISMNGSPGEVVLEVADDGVGARGPEGSGLRGMRERVMAAGGRVERGGPPGMRLKVTVPVGAQ